MSAWSEGTVTNSVLMGMLLLVLTLSVPEKETMGFVPVETEAPAGYAAAGLPTPQSTHPSSVAERIGYGCTWVMMILRRVTGTDWFERKRD